MNSLYVFCNTYNLASILQQNIMQLWNKFLAKKLHFLFVGPFHIKLTISNEIFQSTCSQQHSFME